MAVASTLYCILWGFESLKFAERRGDAEDDDKVLPSRDEILTHETHIVCVYCSLDTLGYPEGAEKIRTVRRFEVVIVSLEGTRRTLS